MEREDILKAGSEYANKHWNVHEKPNEHDNAHDDFIAGAIWASKQLGEIIDCSHPKPWRKVESGFTVCNSCNNIVPRKQVESQNSLE